ncbi:MAG: RNA polymerase sigma-70 factor [Odoribacteraceae bacterium]|jgi:RNA polymerase sigma-70 factor (ECF subfamily)|nr:RNA polymerase sigma-70 factor [Odoribacteraceae bacterium]
MKMNRPEEILHALKTGEQGAFKAFFEEYHDSLLLFATSILKDVDAAEDVVQESFVNFWVGRRFEQVSGALDHYIFRAVRNEALQYLRDRQRRALRHASLAPGIETDASRIEEEIALETDRLYAAIHRLPEERRRIFMMICVEGMKYQEVADRLGISINTVKKQMERAFHFLREVLKNQPFSALLLFFLKKLSLPVTLTCHRGIF